MGRPYCGFSSIDQAGSPVESRWYLKVFTLRLVKPTSAQTLISYYHTDMNIEAVTRDTSNWSVLQYYYNKQVYNSIYEFREAIKSPDFKKSPLNLDGDWTETEDFEEGTEVSIRNHHPYTLIPSLLPEP